MSFVSLAVTINFLVKYPVGFSVILYYIRLLSSVALGILEDRIIFIFSLL